MSITAYLIRTHKSPIFKGNLPTTQYCFNVKLFLSKTIKRISNRKTKSSLHFSWSQRHLQTIYLTCFLMSVIQYSFPIILCKPKINLHILLSTNLNLFFFINYIPTIILNCWFTFKKVIVIGYGKPSYFNWGFQHVI